MTTTALERLEMWLQARESPAETIRVYGIYARTFLKANGKLDCANLSWVRIDDANRFLAPYGERRRQHRR